MDEAVIIALKTVPLLRISRLLINQLPRTDMKRVDNVARYALTALYTHFRFVARADQRDKRIKLARALRTGLIVKVAALPERARAPETQLETPLDLANDLLQRAQLARTYLMEVLPEDKAQEKTYETVLKAELHAEGLLASLEARDERRPSSG